MGNLDNILKLIEEGDKEKILAEKDLVNTFNTLCKYELVEINDDGIFLTQEGSQARLEGSANFIKRKEIEKKRIALPFQKVKKKKKPVSFILALLILFFAFFIITNIYK